MATTGKNRQIVLMTVFATILVVIGHSDITDDFKELWIHKWVYSFHMPLFFFISGFLFCLTLPAEKLRKTTYVSFIKKKSIRLLIPFLFINTIIFIIKAGFIHDQSMMKHPLTMDMESFLKSTFFYPIGFMWFLPALFTIFAGVFYMYKMLKIKSLNKEAWYICGMVFLLIILVLLDRYLPTNTFMQVSNAIYYATYFILGILYCDYKTKVDKFLRKYWYLGILLLVLSVSLCFQRYPAALCGIGFSLVISLFLEEKCSDKLVELSGFTYTVFLLSYFPQMMVRGPIAHMFPQINQYVFSVISFVLGLSVPVIIGMIVVKIRDRHPEKMKNVTKLIGL